MQTTVTLLLNKINRYILNPIIGLLFLVALLTFLWGLIELIAKAGSEDARQSGRRNIMWGIVGMFIMIAVYGIIRIILNTFGIQAPTYIAPLLLTQ